MSVASTSPTALEAAVAAGAQARAAAEHDLDRARAARSRAAVALERTAQLRGCDEAERERLRAAYDAADGVVARCQADLDRARQLERAWAVVAGALDAPAAAVLLAVLPAAGAEPGVARPRARASRALTRRAAVALPRAARPRPA